MKTHTRTRILLTPHRTGVVLAVMEMFFKGTHFSSPSKRKSHCLRKQDMLVLFENITDDMRTVALATVTRRNLNKGHDQSDTGV